MEFKFEHLDYEAITGNIDLSRVRLPSLIALRTATGSSTSPRVYDSRVDTGTSFCLLGQITSSKQDFAWDDTHDIPGSYFSESASVLLGNDAFLAETCPADLIRVCLCMCACACRLGFRAL